MFIAQRPVGAHNAIGESAFQANSTMTFFSFSAPFITDRPNGSPLGEHKPQWFRYGHQILHNKDKVHP
jgi:hypothetical protein